MLLIGKDEPTKSMKPTESAQPHRVAAPARSEIKIERLMPLSDDTLKIVVSVTLDHAAARAYVECSILDESGGVIRIMTISLLHLTAGRRVHKERVAYKVAGAKSANCHLTQIVP